MAMWTCKAVQPRGGNGWDDERWPSSDLADILFDFATLFHFILVVGVLSTIYSKKR
jgi:hypothetical protein